MCIRNWIYINCKYTDNRFKNMCPRSEKKCCNSRQPRERAEGTGNFQIKIIHENISH